MHKGFFLFKNWKFDTMSITTNQLCHILPDMVDREKSQFDPRKVTMQLFCKDEKHWNYRIYTPHWFPK